MSPLALSLSFLQAQPDGRLTQLAREGHEPAFEALVRRYRSELLAYCRRLTPEAANAEDNLQQALLQAWRALTAGAEVRDIRPWLYRITHNVAISHLRATAASPPRIEDAAGSFDVDQVVQQRLQARAALTSMASLPELQRQVFVRTTLDGASHEEVATALGLSNGAVRGLIYRARAAMRAAAAAVIPSPALSWAIRHDGTSGRRMSRLVEAAAGGGGAGVAGLVAKGGAVLAVAGAVAGGDLIATLPSPQHRAVGVTEAHSPRASGSGISAGLAADRPGDGDTANARVNTSKSPSSVRERIGIGARSGDHGMSQRETAAGVTTSGHDRGSSGGSDGGSRNGPSGSSGRGPDGDSSAATTAASSDGSPTRSSRAPSGSSGSSPDGGISGGSRLDGETSGTGGPQVTTAATVSGGSSGSDGGPAGSSGDGNTTTTPSPY